MNNNELVNKLKSLVAEERKITSEILNYLREVEAKKIFAQIGYPSLFEFCTRELGYSEGAAQRRVSAMRLIKELPEVEQKIVSGALSLSVVSQAQTFFKKKKTLNKPMARNEKLDLLTSLENSSARQCEKTLLELEPELATKDKERLLAPDVLEIKMTVDQEFIKNLETLKSLLSHQMPQASTKDILAFALRELVKKKDLTRILPIDRARNKPTTNIQQMPSVYAQAEALPPTSAPRSKAYISLRVKQKVWQESEGQCCYKDPATGKKCGSRRYLEIDHIHPKSLGGGNEVHNLQLLCDMHNRLKGARLPISQEYSLSARS